LALKNAILHRNEAISMLKITESGNFGPKMPIFDAFSPKKAENGENSSFLNEKTSFSGEKSTFLGEKSAKMDRFSPFFEEIAQKTAENAYLKMKLLAALNREKEYSKSPKMEKITGKWVF
jgi:hypothetical protein